MSTTNIPMFIVERPDEYDFIHNHTWDEMPPLPIPKAPRSSNDVDPFKANHYATIVRDHIQTYDTQFFPYLELHGQTYDYCYFLGAEIREAISARTDAEILKYHIPRARPLRTREEEEAIFWQQEAEDRAAAEKARAAGKSEQEIQRMLDKMFDKRHRFNDGNPGPEIELTKRIIPVIEEQVYADLLYSKFPRPVDTLALPLPFRMPKKATQHEMK
jgi:hypothetical protein